MAPFDENTDPVAEARAIVNELKKYDEALFHKARWLVLNKVDLLATEDAAERVQKFLADFGWHDKSFIISALSGAGCKELTFAIMAHLDVTREPADAPQDATVEPAPHAENSGR